MSPRAPEVPLCGENTASTLEVWSEGTFTATDLTKPAGQQKATYVGATRATFTATDDYYFNPEGTFANSACTTPLFPDGAGPLDGVDGTLTVVSVSGPTGSNPLGGSVSCTGPAGSAEYGRVGETGLVIAEPMTCTVTNSGVSFTNVSANNTITLDGAQHPCLPPFGQPCVFEPDPPDPDWTIGTEWEGTYTQN